MVQEWAHDSIPKVLCVGSTCCEVSYLVLLKLEGCEPEASAACDTETANLKRGKETSPGNTVAFLLIEFMSLTT